jgi:hypothetical protein
MTFVAGLILVAGLTSGALVGPTGRGQHDGVTNSVAGCLTEAEADYKEALIIERELAASNADREDVSRALEELNKLYGDPQSLVDAEAAYREALSILRPQK